MSLVKLGLFSQKIVSSGRGLHGRNSPLDKTNDIWQPLSLLRGGKTPKGRIKISEMIRVNLNKLTKLERCYTSDKIIFKLVWEHLTFQNSKYGLIDFDTNGDPNIFVSRKQL